MVIMAVDRTKHQGSSNKLLDYGVVAARKECSIPSRAGHFFRSLKACDALAEISKELRIGCISFPRRDGRAEARSGTEAP